MTTCCELQKECQETLLEIVKEGEGMKHKRPANLKIVATKDWWNFQTYSLLTQKGQVMCPKCFYFTKDLMKMCEPFEKFMREKEGF
jgi:hypothetical protein